MTDLGLKTESKHCRKCCWCAEYDDYDVIANTHTPVYSCTFGKGIDGKAPTKPTLDEKCPYFNKPYKEEGEEED